MPDTSLTDFGQLLIQLCLLHVASICLTTPPSRRNSLQNHSQSSQRHTHQSQNLKAMSLQVSTIQTLFDALPTEINVEILRCFLSSPDAYRRALAFGNASEQHRREVIKAFSNKILVNRQNVTLLPELIAFFGNDLRELSAKYYASVFASIPSLPYLRTASIIATKEHMRIIKGASSLTRLHVQLDDETCWNSLITTFASLSLLYLDIGITIDAPPPSAEHYEHFSEACANVKELEITVSGGRYEPYWPLIFRLKSLKCISLTHLRTMEDEHLRFLQGLEKVELGSRKALQQAVRIGHQVTAIDHFVLSAPEENVAKLCRCPNLKRIQITLEEGAERALIGKIDNVLQMELQWGGGLAGSFGMERTYYEPDGKLLLALVNRAPSLRRVRFQYAVVRTKHIRRILKALGSSLVEFAVNVDGQVEPSAWRMTKILKSLATWCPNIEEVDFLPWFFPVSATEDEMNEAQIVLGKVRRKCPHLNILEISERFV